MAATKGSIAGDLTKAINQSLSPGKIVVMAIGFIAATVFCYLLGLLGDLVKPQGLQFLRWTINAIGSIGALFIILSSMTAVAKMALSGESGKKINFLAGIGAIAVSFMSAACAIFSLIALYVGLVVLFWLGGLLGLIPHAGPIVWSLTSPIWVAGALVAAFVIFRIVVATFVLPGIIASKGKGETKASKEAKNVFKEHTFSLLQRLAVTLLLVIVFVILITMGMNTMSKHTSITMGSNAAVLGAPGTSIVAKIGFPLLSGGPMGRMNLMMAGGGQNASRTIAGVIYTIVVTIFSAIVFSIPLIFYALSGAYAYGALKAAPAEGLNIPEVDLKAIKEKAEEFRGRVKDQMEISEAPEKKPEEEPKE